MGVGHAVFRADIDGVTFWSASALEVPEVLGLPAAVGVADLLVLADLLGVADLLVLAHPARTTATAAKTDTVRDVRKRCTILPRSG